MPDFDTDLYEAVMEDQPPYANEPADDDLWILAAASAGRNAARIAAERKATPAPSDEELVCEFWHVTDEGDIRDLSVALEGIRAVRDALGAWPQVPEGWELDSITSIRLGPNRVYKAELGRIDESDFIVGEGPTPQAALAEAVRQAREVES